MELKTHNCEPNLSPKIYNSNMICGLQRKREMKKLEKELQETEAVESQQKRAKLVSAGHNFFSFKNTQILHSDLHTFP